MIRKAGHQFIKAEILPSNAIVHASSCISFDSWMLLEADLLASGATHYDVLRARNMLYSGEISVLVKVPSKEAVR